MSDRDTNFTPIDQLSPGHLAEARQAVNNAQMRANAEPWVYGAAATASGGLLLELLRRRIMQIKRRYEAEPDEVPEVKEAAFRFSETVGNYSQWPYVGLALGSTALGTLGGYHLLKKMYPVPSELTAKIQKAREEFEKLLQREVRASKDDDDKRDKKKEDEETPGVFVVADAAREVLDKRAYGFVQDVSRTAVIPAAVALTMLASIMSFRKFKASDKDRIKARASKEAKKRVGMLRTPRTYVIPLEEDAEGNAREIDTLGINTIPIDIRKMAAVTQAHLDKIGISAGDFINGWFALPTDLRLELLTDGHTKSAQDPNDPNDPNNPNDPKAKENRAKLRSEGFYNLLRLKEAEPFVAAVKNRDYPTIRSMLDERGIKLSEIDTKILVMGVHARGDVNSIPHDQFVKNLAEAMSLRDNQAATDAAMKGHSPMVKLMANNPQVAAGISHMKESFTDPYGIALGLASFILGNQAGGLPLGLLLGLGSPMLMPYIRQFFGQQNSNTPPPGDTPPATPPATTPGATPDPTKPAANTSSANANAAAPNDERYQYSTQSRPATQAGQDAENHLIPPPGTPSPKPPPVTSTQPNNWPLPDAPDYSTTPAPSFGPVVRPWGNTPKPKQPNYAIPSAPSGGPMVQRWEYTPKPRQPNYTRSSAPSGGPVVQQWGNTPKLPSGPAYAPEVPPPGFQYDPSGFFRKLRNLGTDVLGIPTPGGPTSGWMTNVETGKQTDLNGRPLRFLPKPDPNEPPNPSRPILNPTKPTLSGKPNPHPIGLGPAFNTLSQEFSSAFSKMHKDVFGTKVLMDPNTKKPYLADWLGRRVPPPPKPPEAKKLQP